MVEEYSGYEECAVDEAYTRRTWEREEGGRGEGGKDEEEVEEGEEEKEEMKELVIERRNKNDWERENGVGEGDVKLMYI